MKRTIYTSRHQPLMNYGRFHPTTHLQAAQKRMKLVARTAQQLLLVFFVTCMLCIAFSLRSPVRSSRFPCSNLSTEDAHAHLDASASTGSTPPPANRLMRRQIVVSRLWENVSWLMNSEIASDVPVAIYQLVDGNFTQHELNCSRGRHCPRKCQASEQSSCPARPDIAFFKFACMHGEVHVFTYVCPIGGCTAFVSLLCELYLLLYTYARLCTFIRII